MAEKIKKIYHGPVNIGGIGGYISEHMRTIGNISDFIVWSDSTMRQNNHLDLRIDDYSKIRKIMIIIINFLQAFVKYDIFHFYFGKTLLPYGLDLPILRLFRKKIIMSYCGSDIRLIGPVESVWNPYWKYLKISINDPKFDRKKVKMMKWQGLWVNKVTAIRSLHKSALYCIKKEKVLSTPWINNLGFDIINIAKEIKTNDIPIIIHAPSEKGIKGTEYIENAIEKLRKKGLLFKYMRVENIPNKEAQELYKKADIIIDQLLIGSFGTLAVEGMGYGKPVACYIIEEVKKEYFPDCPIYNINIDNIEEKLETLIIDKALRLSLGSRGISFVKKYFDNEKILKEMEKIYAEL